MKSPDELRRDAKSVLYPILIAVLGILTGAAACNLCHCATFTPHIDPAPYPCGDPRMHWCESGHSCCFDGFACIAHDLCEYVGPDEHLLMPAWQLGLDGGADR